MRVERYTSNQRRDFRGCGCGVIFVSTITITIILAVLVAPALPSIGLRLAGFQPIDQPLEQSTQQPIPVINNPQTSSQVTLSAGSFGQRIIQQSSAYVIQVGSDASGTDVTQITLTESGIITLCRQYTDVCSDSSSRFRNVSVNLQNSRATIAGEAFIPQINSWQAISVIASLAPDNSINIDGVEVNGTLFSIPDGELGERIRDIQSTANQAIRQLSLQSDGETYRLSDIVLTETQLVATFR